MRQSSVAGLIDLALNTLLAAGLVWLRVVLVLAAGVILLIRKLGPAE